MPWGPAYWQLNARSYRRDVDTFISDAQLWRSDIDSERDGAQKRAAESKRNNPDVFIELSKLLDDAERFWKMERLRVRHTNRCGTGGW